MKSIEEIKKTTAEVAAAIRFYKPENVSPEEHAKVLRMCPEYGCDQKTVEWFKMLYAATDEGREQLITRIIFDNYKEIQAIQAEQAAG